MTYDQMKAALLAELPRPDNTALFTFAGIKRHSIPHPYCITSAHVVEASEHYCGRLGTDAIRAAEKKGVRCGMEGCRLTVDEHRSVPLVVVAIKGSTKPGNLNDVPGLHTYLLACKEIVERVVGNDGGFLVPMEYQVGKGKELEVDEG